MKAILALFLAFISIQCLARDQFTDNPGQTPRRNVSGYMFDISQSQSGWHLVHATIVRRVPAVLGWVVTGTIDGTNATIVLKNPPQDVYNRYAPLKTQYDQLLAQYKDAYKNYKDARVAQFQSRSEQTALESADPQRDMVREAKRQRILRQASAEHERDIAANNSAYDRADAILEQITNFDMQGFDLKQPFTFSLYAMKIKQTIEGLPVYDRGLIVR